MAQKKPALLNSDNHLNAPPPRHALTRIAHVRDELARLYRHARTGRIETSEATRLTYILATLAKIIEVSDLEKRIEKLEALSDDY